MTTKDIVIFGLLAVLLARAVLDGRRALDNAHWLRIIDKKLANIHKQAFAEQQERARIRRELRDEKMKTRRSLSAIRKAFNPNYAPKDKANG